MGFQCINHHEFKYREGNIFLLPPLDCHSFRIAEPSRFYFVRFTDHYFMSQEGMADYRSWFDRMTYILANYNRVPGDIISSEREREFIIHNIRAINEENSGSDGFSSSIICGAMASILNILARSIERRYVDQANEVDNRFGEILRYINTHISNGEKPRIVETKVLHTDLSLKEIAYDLNFTDSSHLSKSFKKVYGMTIKEFKGKGQLCR